MKRPSSRDVARLAGVSQATVSFVVNDPIGINRRVTPETRERVLRAIRELGYQPNEAARTLRTQRTQLVALLTPDLTNPFYPVVAQAIQDVLQTHGFELLVSSSRADPERERRFLDTVIRRGADGVIITAWHLSREDVEPIVKSGIGFVSMGSDFGSSLVSTVASHDHRGAMQAMRYLLRKGHRRIAHIAGTQYSLPGTLRLESYRAALEAAAVPMDEELIVYGDFMRGSAGALARTLMACDDPPTAIFVANDTMAVEVLLTLQQLGFRVPDDVAIVGYDDTVEAQLVRPQLTTVRQPVAEMSRAAAEMLIALIGDPHAKPRHEFFEPELMIRGSA